MTPYEVTSSVVTYDVIWRHVMWRQRRATVRFSAGSDPGDSRQNGILRGDFFQCRVYPMKYVQNLKSFWRTIKNLFVLVLLSILYSFLAFKMYLAVEKSQTTKKISNWKYKDRGCNDIEAIFTWNKSKICLTSNPIIFLAFPPKSFYFCINS